MWTENLLRQQVLFDQISWLIQFGQISFPYWMEDQWSLHSFILSSHHWWKSTSMTMKMTTIRGKRTTPKTVRIQHAKVHHIYDEYERSQTFVQPHEARCEHRCRCRRWKQWHRQHIEHISKNISVNDICSFNSFWFGFISISFYSFCTFSVLLLDIVGIVFAALLLLLLLLLLPLHSSTTVCKCVKNISRFHSYK